MFRSNHQLTCSSLLDPCLCKTSRSHGPHFHTNGAQRILEKVSYVTAQRGCLFLGVRIKWHVSEQVDEVTVLLLKKNPSDLQLSRQEIPKSVACESCDSHLPRVSCRRPCLEAQRCKSKRFRDRFILHRLHHKLTKNGILQKVRTPGGSMILVHILAPNSHFVHIN